MLRLLCILRINACLQEREGCTASLEGRGQVHIARNDATVEQRKHAVLNVILSDGGRIGERVVSEVLRENSFGLVSFASLPLANA